MSERYHPTQVHHMLWTRNEWCQAPLARQVRRMGAYLIDLENPVHRLLHASTVPPEVPDHETLQRMRSLATKGIRVVINGIDHPIAEHLDSQLIIATIDPAVAQSRLDRGDYRRAS